MTMSSKRGGARTRSKSIVIVSKYITKNRCKTFPLNVEGCRDDSAKK